MTIDEFDKLYLDFSARIFEFIRRRVQTPGSSNELAEDMAAEVFHKALEATQRGVEVTHASGWLFRIARNAVIDHYRHQSCYLPTVSLDGLASDEDYDGYAAARIADALASPEPSPHELAEQAITVARVRRALGWLTDDQEYVMTLRLEGYEYSEIAAEMGRTTLSAKQLGVRALARLADTLERIA